MNLSKSTDLVLSVVVAADDENAWFFLAKNGGLLEELDLPRWLGCCFEWWYSGPVTKSII